MFRLRTAYFISGIATGLMLLFGFLASLPDGKLHLVFCDVGQGDASYVRFADGRDMLVDGGPNDKVLSCLGKHMPFWDRHLNLVVLTHPQRDHLQGLIAVFERYRVDYFLRSDVDNSTEGYEKLQEVVKQKNLPIRLVTRGEHIGVGATSLSVLWPSRDQIAASQGESLQSSVLGAATPPNLNDASIVFWLRYGSFEALFTGDADTRVEANWRDFKLADDILEVLKVPHHGSKKGMSEEFIKKLQPKLAVISVGKNPYGHPTKEILEKLANIGSRVLRTDEAGDIEIVSDGRTWRVKTGNTEKKVAL